MSTNTKFPAPFIFGTSGKIYLPFTRQSSNDLAWEDIEALLCHNHAFQGLTPRGYTIAQNALLTSFLLNSPTYQIASLVVSAADCFLSLPLDLIHGFLPSSLVSEVKNEQRLIAQTTLKSMGIDLSLAEIEGVHDLLSLSLDAAYYSLIVKNHGDTFLIPDALFPRFEHAKETIESRLLELHDPSNLKLKTCLPVNVVHSLFDFTSLDHDALPKFLKDRSIEVQHEILLNPDRSSDSSIQDTIIKTDAPQVTPLDSSPNNGASLLVSYRGEFVDLANFDIPILDKTQSLDDVTLTVNGNPPAKRNS